MTTPRRTYTKSVKAKAVGLAIVKGTMKAAEELDIPAQTVSGWRHLPEYADMVGELRTKSRDALADELWSVIQVGVREVAKGIVGDAPLRDKATALGILYDKHALLTGSATSRSESRDITGSLSDIDVVAAVREAHALATGGRATPPTEDAPEG